MPGMGARSRSRDRGKGGRKAPDQVQVRRTYSDNDTPTLWRRDKPRSRSRSLRGRRDSGRDHGRGRGRDSDQGKKARGEDDDVKPKASSLDLAKTGVQKAKEAIEKEREKARQKKLDREKAQKDKEDARKQTIEKKRETAKDNLDKQLEEGGAAGLSEQAKILLNEERDKEAEKEAASPTLEAAQPPASPSLKSRKRIPPLDEDVVRQLFDLLDRGGKEQISRRDVMVALRKHPPVRALFRLPQDESLESRLLAIQDAFESGSGLGELSPAFDELRAGSDAQSFGWPAFLECCRNGSMIEQAHAAAGFLPREHKTGVEFVPTEKWEVVPEGAACPAGLEYKMDMSTGKTLGRLPPKKPQN